jgi:hypothetical protein
MSRDIGHVEITPHEAVAGRRGTWTLTYTVGECGMAVGSEVRVVPPRHGTVRWGVGHVCAYASRPDVFLEVLVWFKMLGRMNPGEKPARKAKMPALRWEGLQRILWVKMTRFRSGFTTRDGL